MNGLLNFSDYIILLRIRGDVKRPLLNAQNASWTHDWRNKSLERRYAERIKAGFKAEIVHQNSIYTGIVENISASGINVLSDPLPPGTVFHTDEAIEIRFRAPSGDTVVLKCTIMWSAKIPPHNVRHRMGMEIVELPWDKFNLL